MRREHCREQKLTDKRQVILVLCGDQQEKGDAEEGTPCKSLQAGRVGVSPMLPSRCPPKRA